MKYEDIKVGMLVKIHMNKNELAYAERYEGFIGEVKDIYSNDTRMPIVVNVPFEGKLIMVAFKPKELTEVK